jgi:asparagine synthase (glutamine-hydrolysing)
MSSIFSLLNNNNTFTPIFVDNQFQKGKKCGHQYSKLSQSGVKVMMGIHQTNVNNSDSQVNQPIVDGDIILLCDGEIYNYKELYRFMNIQQKTTDCNEIIIHLYRKYGIEHTLQMLDGVFSFIILDNDIHSENFKIFIARDPYGVKPLYILNPNQSNSIDEKDQIISISSDIKVLYEFYNTLTDNSNEKNKRKNKNKTISPNEKSSNSKYRLTHFLPGTYSSLILSSKVFSSWSIEREFVKYHTNGFNSIMYYSSPQYHDAEIILNVQRYLIRAIEKRCSMANAPMACLLSGGLDSSIIAGLVRQYHVTHDLPQLETFSIGMEGCDDLKYAKQVADHLGTKHTEIIIKEEELLNLIPEVIKCIETYDVSTVRSSLPNYLLGKYIHENSKAKIIFNGDGADELFGGYLYMYLANESIEFDKEVRELLSNIHLYDGLRSEKTFSQNGLITSSPYLDTSFVQYYLSIPPQLRFHTRNEQCEKYLLRLAFHGENYRNSTNGPLIPEEVLWRTKEEYVDGISLKTNSFHTIVNKYATEKFQEEFSTKMKSIKNTANIYSEILKFVPEMNKLEDHLLPQTAEQFMYRREFEKCFNGLGKLLPKYWLPKYEEKITDPSARTLEIYYEEENKQDEKEIVQNIDI